MCYYVIRKKDHICYWQGESDSRSYGFTSYPSEAKHFPTFDAAEQEQKQLHLNGCMIVVHFIENVKF